MAQEEQEGQQTLVGTFMKELTSMREKLKDEDAEYVISHYAGLEKSAVLQECRSFNDANFQSNF